MQLPVIAVVQALILEAILVATVLLVLEELERPLMIWPPPAPLTVIVLILALLAPVIVRVAPPVAEPEPLTVMVVLGVSARRTLVKMVFTGCVPSCEVVDPTALSHSL